MCKRLIKLRTVLTVMHLEGDIKLFLTVAQWNIVTGMTVAMMINVMLFFYTLFDDDVDVTMTKAEMNILTNY